MPSAVNEVQTITVTADGGTWAPTFKGVTGGDVAFDAAAATLQTALRAISSIGSGNVNVTGSAGGPYTVTFVGALAHVNVPKIGADPASLTGTDAGVDVETLTPGSALNLNEGGVPMMDGDPSEPQGPEDALGVGTKRGDYSGRGDGASHFQGTTLQTLGPFGDHADQPSKKGGVTTT